MRILKSLKWSQSCVMFERLEKVRHIGCDSYISGSNICYETAIKSSKGKKKCHLLVLSYQYVVLTNYLFYL